MDPLRTIAGEVGFFTRTEAKSAGYGDRDITRMVRRGSWRRIRRGSYVFADAWSGLDDIERHLVRSAAVMRSLGDAVALSHASGVVRHRLDCWGLDLRRVHVTRLDGGAGRLEGDVVHHEGFCLDDEVVTVDGMQVLRPQRCVLEAGSRVRNEVALCLMDAGLRAAAYDRDQLTRAYDVMRHWPFAHHLEIPIVLADGRSASVGESRGKWLFHASGIPMPELQHEVRRPDGSLAAITDWCWPTVRGFGEFDGAIKYGRLLRPGQDPGDAVFEEKRREDEIRELTGGSMIRLTWSDYDIPAVTKERLIRFLGRPA